MPQGRAGRRMGWGRPHAARRVIRHTATSLLRAPRVSPYGLTDISRHVIDTLVEPSFLELHGILRRGEQCLSGPTSRLRRPRVRAGQILHATS